MTRVIARIPAARGRVERITVQVRVEDIPDGVAVDVADVQLQGGADPSGVVPHPSDVAVRSGQRQFRNGVVTRSDTIIALANPDRASPTRVHVSAAGDVRVGSYRFGAVNGSATADGAAGTATQGWGRVPVVTERSDLQAQVIISRPTHVTVEWVDRM
ncbi:hypothetical protein [Microbacterium caowuchunii]|uniref:Uncharacterized protein n=1 Tax=Microbacterium caowuchunii TaxID=2614638 RepID=A0A5N0TIQ8_9MICO|nr:hypothetical protein [Microbacterium caowuchunii]KAA9133766.1 hypothetical protein F6B40_08425 [Microbacterium caowuchunii]